MNKVIFMAAILMISSLLLSNNPSQLTIKDLQAPTPQASASYLDQTDSLSSNVDKFKYPNSEIISSFDHKLVLESDDDPTKITKWYKEQIQKDGMKTTSFVETNTNNEILNQLIGANQFQKITVTIHKASAQSTARIEINL